MSMCNKTRTLLHHLSPTNNLVAIKRLHGHLLRTGLLFASLTVHTKLIYSYSPFFDEINLETLTNCFKFLNPENPLPFNMIVSDFCRNGFHIPCVKTFSFMHSNSVPLDSYALCSTLTASTSLKDINFGEMMHTQVIKSGWLSSVFLGSALVDFYAKNSLVFDASKMFDEIPLKNTVCANALLSGYCEAKMWIEGLEFVRKMPMLGLIYDHFTVTSMLRLCAALSVIELGRQVHAYLLRNHYNLEKDAFLLSSLIEMYGRSGFVDKASKMFDLAGMVQGLKKRDIVVWTSMLGMYGKNGNFKEVIMLFEKMSIEGIEPDGIAFVTIISACAHTGQVDLGTKYFESMINDYKLEPKPEHYSALVDLLCRGGELDRALTLIRDLIDKGHGGRGSVSMWGALLSACDDHGNLELGRLAAQSALELESHNVGIYVMLSNLYAKFGLWDEIDLLRKVIKEKGLYKDAGFSHVEVTNPITNIYIEVK